MRPLNKELFLAVAAPLLGASFTLVLIVAIPSLLSSPQESGPPPACPEYQNLVLKDYAYNSETKRLFCSYTEKPRQSPR